MHDAVTFDTRRPPLPDDSSSRHTQHVGGFALSQSFIPHQLKDLTWYIRETQRFLQ